MDQTKLIGQRANDFPDNAENRICASIGANEIRTLGDLDLMVAGGGDGITVWTPPTP